MWLAAAAAAASRGSRMESWRQQKGS